MTLRLTLEDGLYVLKGKHSLCRRKARHAGMLWDRKRERWFTRSIKVAARLRVYAVGRVKRLFEIALIEVTPWTAPLLTPPQGLKADAYQDDAAIFSLSRNRSYLGVPPGLGKTIIAATIAINDALVVGRRCVYLLPPFLVGNVQEEFAKWAPEVKTFVLTDLGPFESPGELLKYQVLIVPDSCIRLPEARALIRFFSREEPKPLLIIDEAHRYSRLDAQRTQALFDLGPFGIRRYMGREVYMSGSPLPNRPMDLYPMLSRVAPETIDFMSQFDYGRRYCEAYRSRFGWVFTGASNVKELRSKVVAPTGVFMLRVDENVVKLPPLREEVFILSEGMKPQLAKLDDQLSKSIGDSDDLVSKLQEKRGKSKDEKLHQSTYLKLLGEHKAKASVEYIQSILEETEESVLVFAHHKEALAILVKRLAKYRPLVITGATPVNKRHARVKKFQNDKRRRLFIGSIRAMGIGYNMTKATRVLCVEWSWVPGENSQAFKRAHRRGQDKPVLVQYVAVKNSLDRKVLSSVLKKRKSISEF